MSSERTRAAINMHGDMDPQDPILRSLSDSDRESEQVTVELDEFDEEESDEEHRMVIAQFDRIIANLNDDTAFLRLARPPRLNSVTSDTPNTLDLGSPTDSEIAEAEVDRFLDTRFRNPILSDVVPDTPSTINIGSPALLIEEPESYDSAVPFAESRATFIDQLQNVGLSDLPDDCQSCNICMDQYYSAENPESPVRLPCQHVFGRNCISKWSVTNNSCPLCRRTLFEHEAWPTQAHIRAVLDDIERGNFNGENEQTVLNMARAMEFRQLRRANEEMGTRLRDLVDRL